MKNFQQELIETLYEFNVSADISIESLAETITGMAKQLNGNLYVQNFHSCPICADCPDNCPLESEDKKCF